MASASLRSARTSRATGSPASAPWSSGPAVGLAAGLGTTFIIDLWFSGIIVAGLVGSRPFSPGRGFPRLPRRSRSCRRMSDFRMLQKAAGASSSAASMRAAAALAGADVAAHPRPVSPFNWTVFVSDEREHHYAHVNLVRDAPREFRPGDGFVAQLDARLPAACDGAVADAQPLRARAPGQGGLGFPAARVSCAGSPTPGARRPRREQPELRLVPRPALRQSGPRLGAVPLRRVPRRPRRALARP